MAKVYVGTYRKYNSGSLKGRWISLDRCESYSDFLNLCKEAHKDEEDPEFMIQDYDDMPDGLSCGEWLSEQDFLDIKKEIAQSIRIIDYSTKSFAVVGDTKPLKDGLKCLGGKFNPKLSCGAGWIFSKKNLSKVQDLIGNGTIEKTENSSVSDLIKRNLNEFVEISGEEYLKKYKLGAVKISNGWYFMIDKNSIENEFCFSDEGPEYEFYKSLRSDDNKMKQYFINANLSPLKEKIEKIENNQENIVMIKNQYEHKGLKTCFFFVDGEDDFSYYQSDEKYIATREDVKNLISALKFQYEQFEKRINTYLKKYGISKLRTWSYWVNA